MSHNRRRSSGERSVSMSDLTRADYTSKSKGESTLRPTLRGMRRHSSKDARMAHQDRSALCSHLGTLLRTGGGDSASSDDEIDLDANFIPTRLRRPPSPPKEPTTKRKPSATAVNFLPRHPGLASVELVDINAGPWPETATGSRGSASPGSPSQVNCAWHSDGSDWSSKVHSLSTLSSDPHDEQATIEMPLPIGFEHASIKQIFDSIDAMLEHNKSRKMHGSPSWPDILINGESTSLETLETTPQPSSPAMDLPAEIILHIFKELHPVDVNAARHTCRAWMNATLNKHFLRQMLCRGAWWPYFRRFAKAERTPMQSQQQSLSSLWLMSCFYSQECALSGSWTGNGLARINYALPTCDHHWGALR